MIIETDTENQVFSPGISALTRILLTVAIVMFPSAEVFAQPVDDCRVTGRIFSESKPGDTRAVELCLPISTILRAQLASLNADLQQQMTRFSEAVNKASQLDHQRQKQYHESVVELLSLKFAGSNANTGRDLDELSAQLTNFVSLHNVMAGDEKARAELQSAISGNAGEALARLEVPAATEVLVEQMADIFRELASLRDQLRKESKFSDNLTDDEIRVLMNDGLTFRTITPVKAANGRITPGWVYFTPSFRLGNVDLTYEFEVPGIRARSPVDTQAWDSQIRIDSLIELPPSASVWAKTPGGRVVGPVTVALSWTESPWAPKEPTAEDVLMQDLVKFRSAVERNRLLDCNRGKQPDSWVCRDYFDRIARNVTDNSLVRLIDRLEIGPAIDRLANVPFQDSITEATIAETVRLLSAGETSIYARFVLQNGQGSQDKLLCTITSKAGNKCGTERPAAARKP